MGEFQSVMRLAKDNSQGRGLVKGLLPERICVPYDWALEQLRVRQAHEITQGDPSVVVAVIDLGYRFHPDHEGHLWMNPNPTKGDMHGWDFADDDATLEYTGPGEDTSTYHRGHHAFVVGEVAAVAPACPIMICRVGYGPGQGESWWRAVDYAVEHGAKVLVLPHGYIHGQVEAGIPWFYQGTDFAYPHDNPRLRQAFEDAHRAGCLLFKPTCDNRGRRVAAATPALEAVIAVGSSNRHGEAADIAASADYVEVAAPSGARDEGDIGQVWGTGGDGDYIPMSGGCMSSGFAAGVAALAMSRYPGLSNYQIRQILRNTARGSGWNAQLGHGILDAAAAVSLEQPQLCQRLAIRPDRCSVAEGECGWRLRVALENQGVYDVQRALVVVYDGDPGKPVDLEATVENPNILLTRQLGHTIVEVPGLEDRDAEIILCGWDGHSALYAQVCSLDLGGMSDADTALLQPTRPYEMG